MSKEELNERKKRVFDWVFGQSKSQPRTTPAPRFIPPSQNSGGPLTNFTHDRNESNQHIDQVLWDRSWRTVTENLALPDYPSHLDPIQSWNPEMKTAGAGFSEALQDLLSPQTRLPRATYTEDIIAWYTSQVRHHFMRQVLPILPELQDEIAPQVLYKTITILETVHRLYLNRLSMILEDVTSMRHLSSPRIMRRFHRDLHAVISNLVTPKIAASLQTVLKWNVSTILGLPSERDQRKRQMFVPTAETRTTARVRDELLRMIESLRNVGLAGEKFQIMFAEIMNDLMTDYVLLGCEGIWSDPRAQKRRNGRRTPASTNDRQESILPRTAQHASPSKCVRELCEWIENRYAKLVVQVFQVLDGTEVKHAKGPLIQVEKWKEISIGHLASLRTNELFDIILKWPHSSAALDDLRTAITTPQRRLQLTNVFAQTLNERLLHPGASTLQILQTYISMISSFHALDHSKVLLDRVAYPLQLYLCSREDTVRIIITGLLSDAEDLQRNPVGSGGEKLVELASLLNEDEEQLGQKANDEELDWHDPDWLPDPVDAGPGYKRSKNADVIGTLIGVLGSQDVFIKEFQNIIAEHLLKNDGGFEREVKVLELLKARFGEAPLQSCEVMLKDIQDSGRVDTVIRRNQRLDPSDEEIRIANASFDPHEGVGLVPEGVLKPSLHAKILSRLFWPQLHDESYRVPDSIRKLQKRYEDGFRSLKASRKLTWLHALGQATVVLELTDRTITEEVHTWQATVIWAFQSDQPDDAPVRKSVQELTEKLEMEEALVRSALKFWASKLVLEEIEKDVFSVLETLNQEDRARSNAQVTASTAAVPDDTALVTNDGITPEKMQMYWQYIQGMLKNSSSQMPLQQIAMMLKMLIADGFPYSNEELQEFLGWKVAAGELEFVGGKYKLKK